MASKMKKKEIEEFIKSKSTTQDTYIAPTVRTHVDTKVPAMAQVAQTVKPTIGQTAGYIGKAAKTGLVGGVTSVPTSNLQEIEGGLKKGKNIKNAGDVAKQIVNSLSTISNITNPLSMQNVLNTASNMSKSTKKALKDKNKDTLSKALSIGTAAVSNAADMANPTHQLAESVFPLVGAVDKKSDQKVRNLIDTINKPNEKLQQELAEESQNHGKVANVVASGVQAATNMIPSLAATAITKNPNIGMAVMANNVKGQATEEALKQGKSLEEAREIGNVRAAAEVATEMLSGGLANIYGKGATDDVAKNIIDRYIQNPTANFLATKASGIVGENVEESLSNVLNKAIDKGTVDPNAKVTMNDITEPWGPTTISTLLLNGATGDYGRASFNQNAAQLQAQSPITKVQNMNDVERNALTEITMKRKQGIPLDENDMATINYLNNRDNVVTDQNVPLNQNVQQTQENNFVYEPTDNVKINNFRQSASQFMNNSQQTQDFVKTVEKVINDKNYNITFDNTIGDDVNGRIRMNNGEVEIKINPNSERAGEFILTHEITHGIETKEMSNLIMDYASKNSEFNDALQSLKESYGTEDITPEVVADISGQMFGDEAFITNLSTTKPNVFKTIYNKIISLANKITGNSNEALFVRDLKNKWEKAYREANIETARENLGNETKLSKEQSKKVKLSKQKLLEDFKKLTGDSKLIADSKMGRYQMQLMQKEAGNFDGEVQAPYSDEAMELFNHIENSSKTSSHLYHSTPADRIQSIVENGLKIGSKQNQEGVSSKDKLYLSATEELARSFAPEDEVTLRIKPNAKLENLDNDLLGGEGAYTITNNIEPKYLQVKENGKWIDLLKSKYANIKELDNSSFSMKENNDMRDRAKNELGTTTNLNEAGYLTDDGEYLDFSGKRQGARGGQRQMDHREISDIYSDNEYDAAEKKYSNMGSATAILQDFISRGNIRLNGTGVEIATAPTQQQYDKLYDYLEHVQRDNGEVFIDLDTESNNRENLEYTDKTSISKMIKDIKNHYANSNNVDNLNPTDSDDIRYSKENKQWRDFLEKNFKNEGKKTYFENTGMPMAEVGNVSKGTRSNIIQKQVDNYIKNNEIDFTTKPNVKTDFVRKDNINYANAKQTTIFKKIRDTMSKFKTNTFKNSNTNKDIVVSSQDINKDINNTLKDKVQRALINEHIAVYDNIDEVIKNAEVVTTANETKGRENYDNWNYYVSPINIDNKPYIVEFDTVKYNNTGDEHFRLKRLIEVSNNKKRTNGGGGYPLDTTGSYESNISQTEQNVNKSSRFKNLTKADETRLNEIFDIQRRGGELSQSQVEELQYLERKEKGLKFPELTKSDQLNKADYAKYYAKANMNNFDSTMLNKAKNIVQPNKQGRRTKQQWLDVAENIGNQASNMDAESLKRYAYESFKEAKPNQAENLNRQGEKYVKFGVQEWVNAVYDGAGVGTKNIAEKKADSVITVRNNKGQEMKLTQDKNNPNVYEKEVKIPKDNKSIVPKETMQKQLAKLKDGTKVSNFYSNLTENSKFITQENANKLSQEEIWRYAPQTNKETMANAEARIGDTQKSLETAYGDFLSKNENFSPEDVGVGWILLKRFQDAGNYDAMVQVAKKMRNIATKSGQTVQMFNLQSRLTPEGMVKYAQSELMEAEQQFNKGKSQKEIDKYAKDFELTGEEVEFIKNQMEKIQGMEDGRAKNIEMAKINKMLSDKLPHQRGDSIKAWMRMSMLFNPKTQVRNVVGNALITPINALADVPASIADKAISKKTGTRTIGAPSLSGLATYGKGFAKGGVEAWQDYRMGLDTKDVDMSRFDITQKNPFVTDHKGAARVLNPISKGLNKANAFLDLVMSGGDRVFYQGAFDASLRNQMELNNVKTPTQDMIDIATQEALARTWNDNNGYTQFVLNTRRALNKASIGGYGLGDVLIPFAKTPANLTKAIYDYSPVGLTTTLFKTKSINNAIETGQITAQMQHDFAQNLGKGVAGTMLYAMAYALAKAGIATGSSDDDKDVANFIKNTMGIQPYSIKIGDKSFTYDWAQPVAAPIAIASDAYQNLTRDSDEDTATRIFNTILDVSNTGFNVLMQQSFLQGISEVLNSNEGVANGIIEQVIGLPARAVPTFVQQINNMFDKTQRVAFEKNQPLKTGKQNVMSKLPGQSQRLAPRVDALGNEVQRYGDSESDLTYALKNFLSPANQSNRKTSKAASEIYEVYEATGDKTIMPMVAPYYIQNKTVGRIDLDSKDRATYQKISGKLINDAVVELTDDADYNKLSYDEKAEVLNGVVSYANAKAKEHFTGFMANTYNPANKKINNGMSIADYYLEKTMNKR